MGRKRAGGYLSEVITARGVTALSGSNPMDWIQIKKYRAEMQRGLAEECAKAGMRPI
jgi:hypothetical protein